MNVIQLKNRCHLTKACLIRVEETDLAGKS
ncbi:rCG40954 [Rattus norvegicus]|uniref:RCG40954 n=1 Tax=Rattus norvegicus TaxID=10116 RepID=A6KMS1_RAT|nr:rCG40954 [Rattus norvegicus]